MSETTLQELVQRAVAVNVLTEQDITALSKEIGRSALTKETFVQTALRRGMLTNYQLDRLEKGDSVGYFFGEYKALYIVGAGTFARVFRAEHRTTGEVAAIKVLRARFSENQTFISHFLNEAKTVAELRHPNIVPVYFADSKGYTHYMVMDFVEGQTLRQFLKVRKKVEPRVVVQVGIDICCGLEYALRKKIQHRDLKLSNVLLSSTGQSKIVDFGLATISQTEKGVDVPFLRNQQSVDYIALEKASGGQKMDDRSDLYFLGTMLYHLLCGQSPFTETKEKVKRMDRNRFFDVKPIIQVDPSVPHSFAFLINKAISVNPDQRYQTPAEMLIDLQGVQKRLEAGTADESVASLRFDGLSAAKTTREKRLKSIQTPTVMIVDSNPKTQKGMATLVVKFGYMATTVENPDQAQEKLAEDDLAAQCVIINAKSLGMRAVRGFNDLGQRRGIKEIPAILILEKGQEEWAESIKETEHRLVLKMPVSGKQFRETLLRLLAPRPAIAATEPDLT